MSDDEYSYHYSDEDSGNGDNDEPMGSDQEEEEEEFEYTDDEHEDKGDDTEISLENTYYNAKQLRDGDEIDNAIQEFERAIQMEKDHLGGGRVGLWTFKCLKQIVKIRMRRSEFQQATDVYKRLLSCVSHPQLGGVSPNALEKGIHGMLDRVSAIFNSNYNYSESNPAEESAAQNLAKLVYDSTLHLFHPQHGTCPNERLWFKTNLKYGQLLYEKNETAKLQSVIQDLLDVSGLKQQQSSATGEIRSISSSSSTHLMEIYALQIQLYSRLKDTKALREIFGKAMRVQGGIPHPRTLALIQELGGKMHMASKEYDAACTTFFQAFKCYDEAGDSKRLRCLKYLVLATMLDESSINPFDSQEVRPYKNDPEIIAMTNLVDAFHSNDIKSFDRILDRNEGRVMEDEFIREYVSDLRRTIRKQVLLQVVQPYTRISLRSLAAELNGISIQEIETLLVSLILDGEVDGRIDQVKGILEKSVSVGKRSHAADEHATQGTHTAIGSMGSNNNKEHTLSQFTGNTINIRTIDAMEDLMKSLESLTSAVIYSVSQVDEKVLKCETTPALRRA
jgi:26S proteasome regulatory complex component